MAALSTVVWTNRVIQQIADKYPGLEFVPDFTQFIEGGMTVNYALAGAAPTVTKNPNSFPLTATQRTDTQQSLTLSEYSTTPTPIRRANLEEVPYNKVESVLSSHTQHLASAVAEAQLADIIDSLSLTGGTPYDITAAAYSDWVGLTTGSDRASDFDGSVDVAAITLADILKAKTKLDRDNVPASDRYMMVDSVLEADLLQLPSILTVNSMPNRTLPTGMIGQLLGFSIIKAPNGMVFNHNANGASADTYAYGKNGETPYVPGKNRAAALFFHSSVMARAMGQVNIYRALNDPTWQGDIYSMNVRAGATYTRDQSANNKLGVYLLIEGESA